MGALDPASAAARLAAIILRCDDQRFTVTTAATSYAWVTHPLQAVFRPTTKTVVLVSWSAVYKGAPFGDSFVCDSSIQALALAALVDYATQTLDVVDIHRKALGFDNTYLPSGGPPS